MKVLIAGDWHGNAIWGVKVIHHAKRSHCDAIVHAGDFGYWDDPILGSTRKYLKKLHEALEKTDLHLYWVDGNHECHTHIEDMVRTCGKDAPIPITGSPRIHYLPRGYRWEWLGKTWMALGGAVSVDRLHRKAGKSWWPGEVLSDADVEYASRNPVDIIISHDCPYGVDIPGIGPATKGGHWPDFILQESEDHRRKVQKVVEATKPTHLFHGHYHRSYIGGYQYRDGSHCHVRGLDMDGSTLEGNCAIVG